MKSSDFQTVPLTLNLAGFSFLWNCPFQQVCNEYRWLYVFLTLPLYKVRNEFRRIYIFFYTAPLTCLQWIPPDLYFLVHSPFNKFSMNTAGFYSSRQMLKWETETIPRILPEAHNRHCSEKSIQTNYCFSIINNYERIISNITFQLIKAVC